MTDVATTRPARPVPGTTRAYHFPRFERQMTRWEKAVLDAFAVTLYPHEYNPKTNQSIRSTVGATWNPGSFRVVSAAYRRQRGFSEVVGIDGVFDVDHFDAVVALADDAQPSGARPSEDAVYGTPSDEVCQVVSSGGEGIAPGGQCWYTLPRP